MEPQNISAYISEKVREGVSKRNIHEQLSAVGWSDDEIDAAYAEALVQNGVPVPEEGTRGAYAKKSTPVEVVLNFFSFILLGIIVTSLGVLYFGIINYFFPDSLEPFNQWRYESMRDSIHYAMAAIIIGFPLYVLAVRMWFRKFREDEGKIESKLTKWITYLVLLVAAVTIVGDLIAVLNTFLQGEVTARFFLKGVTILVIAASVFGFYFLERKKIQYRQDIERKTFKLFGWVYLGIIIVGLILGFFAAGTPGTERQRTFDTQRSNDLQQLASCVGEYARIFQEFPVELNALGETSQLSYCSQARDPETGEEYEYSIVSPLSMTESGLLMGSFRLCADFAFSTEHARQPINGNKWYVHEAGNSCDIESVSFSPNDTRMPVRPIPLYD